MRTSIFTALVCAILLQACKQPGNRKNTDGPLIVVTTGMVARCHQAYCGPGCTGRGSDGTQVDPHLYKGHPGATWYCCARQILSYIMVCTWKERCRRSSIQLAETKPVYAMGAGIPPQNLLDANGPQQKIMTRISGLMQASGQVLCRNWDISLSSNMPEHSDSLILLEQLPILIPCWHCTARSVRHFRPFRQTSAPSSPLMMPSGILEEPISSR